MQSKLSYIKSKLRDNGELVLGVSSILCFYTIVISSLANNTLYFSVLFDVGEYWPDMIWKALLLAVSVLTLASCFKGTFLIDASKLSHAGLLFYYNLFSTLSFSTADFFSVLNFSLWWLSLLISLAYFGVVSKKGKMTKSYYFCIYVFVFTLLTTIGKPEPWTGLIVVAGLILAFKIL